MRSLIDLARDTGEREIDLPSGLHARIRTLKIQFPLNDPPNLPENVGLNRTYTIKPLVLFDNQPLFGELAVLRCLQKACWNGVWVDTFHGRKFWNAMPHQSSEVRLPDEVQARFDAIRIANGGRFSRCFDVMAWKSDRVAFVEYKRHGDSSNANERTWIDAAIRAGVHEQDLTFVLY